MIPSDANKIILEFYDTQNTSAADLAQLETSFVSESEPDDEDKKLFTKIGRTEISVDKVLSKLLVVDEFQTLRNIVQQQHEDQYDAEDEDVYSNHSGKFGYSTPDIKTIVVTKGKVFLIFHAELTDEFIERMERVKKLYIKDT